MAARPRMDAVGHKLQRHLVIERIGLFKRRNNRSVEVGDIQLFTRRQLGQKLAIAQQDCIVASVEHRRTGDVVIRRGQNGGDPNSGQRAFDVPDDGLEPAAISLEDLGIVRPIASIVHPQHDGEDRRLVWYDVALQAYIDGTAPASGYTVAAPPGVDEADLHPRKPGEYVAFREGRVESLIGDAVAV